MKDDKTTVGAFLDCSGTELYLKILQAGGSYFKVSLAGKRPEVNPKPFHGSDFPKYYQQVGTSNTPYHLHLFSHSSCSLDRARKQPAQTCYISLSSLFLTRMFLALLRCSFESFRCHCYPFLKTLKQEIQCVFFRHKTSTGVIKYFPNFYFHPNVFPLAKALCSECFKAGYYFMVSSLKVKF